ncbi:MAG: hypothetical protein ACTHKH_09945 [Trinickia sp.]
MVYLADASFPSVPPSPSPGPAPKPPSTSGAQPAPTHQPTTPAATTPPAPKIPDAKVIAAQLAAGQTLKAGEAIRSANGQYELEMGKDGNLVLYDVANGNALWSSNTSGSGAQAARLDNGGNLQVVNGNNVVWQTKTGPYASAGLVVQDDGNLVLGAKTATVGTPPQTLPVWSSKTSALPVDIAGQNGSAQQPAIPTQPTPAATFGPGLPELGAQTYTIHCPASSSGSAWSIFENNGVKGLPGTLDQNLAATPFLDRKAFGTRPANPVDAVYTIPNGQQVTVLDAARLKYLEQERTQIAAVEQAGNANDKTDKTATLANTIEDEIDYAGTQQALPDPDALAQSIAARAPNDKDFQTAVQAGVVLFKARLAAEGRTSAQLGAVQKAAQSGDWATVQKLTAQQIAAAADGTTGSTALGKMLAKGGVYLTYPVGDQAKYAQSVRAGIADAQKQVLLDTPVSQVQAAYKKGGGAAAMAQLNKITDPQTALPGQVAQIMSDSRIQGVVKDSLTKANWTDGDSRQMMSDLGAACQHAIEADQGERGTGAKAVDAIADQVLSVSNDMEGAPHLLDDPSVTTQVYRAMAAQGNASLGLAVAARATQRGDTATAAHAIDATRAGIDLFSSGTSDLNKQAAKDAIPFARPLHDFGGDSSPQAQAAYLKQLLADNPSEAKALDDDGVKLGTQQEKFDGIKMAIASYSPALNGVEGFNVDVGNDRRMNPTLQTSSKSVLDALNASPAIGTTGKAVSDSKSGNAAPTNYLWMMRATRNVAYQTLTAFVATDPRKLPDALKQFSVHNAFSDSLKAKLFSKNAQGVYTSFTNGGLVKRANSLVSGALFDANGLTLLNGFQNEAHTAATWIEDGSYAYQHLAVGLTQGASALLPQNLAAIRPGSGKTVIQNIFDATKNKILDMPLGDSTKRLLTGLAGAAMRDTMDVAYFGIDFANMVEYAKDANSVGDYERSVGEGISAAGDAMFLLDAAASATNTSELGALGAETLFGAGEGAVGWSGIGAVVVALGAGIYSIGSAESHSHAYDKNDQQLLEAMGVKTDVAAQLAKHAFSFSDNAPTAGPFLTEYFKSANVSDKGMVAWLNSLTPHQADQMATELKSIDGLWEKTPMSQLGPKFDDWLLANHIAPPMQLVADK